MATSNNTTHGNQCYRHTLFWLSGLSIFGVPANLLVIILIFRARKKKFHSMTFLLLNLAVADLINILVVDTAAILFLVVDDHGKQKMPVLILTLIPVIVANFTLAIISFERYNALVRTMKSFIIITKKKVLFAISTSWLIPLVLVIPMVAYIFTKNFPTCHKRKDWGIGAYVFWSFLLFLGYLIPLVIVIFCYASILKGVYIDGTVLGKTTNEASLNEKKSLVRTLVLVTLLFLVCNVPAIIIRLYLFYLSSRAGSDHRYLYLVAIVFGCLSSTLNPFVYVLQSENYRSQVKTLFRRNHGNKNGMAPPVVLNASV